MLSVRCVCVCVSVFTIRVTIRNNITNVEHDFSNDFVLLKNKFLVEQLQLQTIVFDWVLYFFFYFEKREERKTKNN